MLKHSTLALKSRVTMKPVAAPAALCTAVSCISAARQLLPAEPLSGGGRGAARAGAALRARSMAGAGGRAAASATTSESYTGRGSSTPGVGGRAEHTPRYTLGLLQTPHSSESAGGSSGGGARPGGSSGEGLPASRAAGNSAVKPSVSERGGTVSARAFISLSAVLALSSPAREVKSGPY